MRSRTKEELSSLCCRILGCEPWDDNAVANSADRLAALLMELTGNTGTVEAVESTPFKTPTGLGAVDAVAKAICDSAEADNYDRLPEGIAKALYRQQAEAAIKAYLRTANTKHER